MCRFSDVHCKKCIINLLERISVVYQNNKRQNSFIKDLMQSDVPNLFSEGDDQSIQTLFVDMVCTFIQKNALKEIILGQVTTIMVCT